ncbi:MULTISPECIES: hypothetical protein [Paraburkholderia]|uniref:hypothetical protein n=1 Tax=Paraburkholderia TaxID=1822464 RepID=UPI0015DA2276|nr:hypothetical protein [Paraburkholderia sp. PGU16]
MAASHERLTIESGQHARHGILHVPSLLIFRVREASCRVPKRIVDGCEESTTLTTPHLASGMRHSRRVTWLRAAWVSIACMNLSSGLNRDRAKIAGSSSFQPERIR